jgi:hypothetical protein
MIDFKILLNTVIHNLFKITIATRFDYFRYNIYTCDSEQRQETYQRS